MWAGKAKFIAQGICDDYLVSLLHIVGLALFCEVICCFIDKNLLSSFIQKFWFCTLDEEFFAGLTSVRRAFGGWY